MTRGFTLRTAASEFVRHPSPWIIATTLAAALVARVAVGDFTGGDATLVAAMLAGFPFLEWIIHVSVLHWRPRRVGPVMLDPLLARKHREHHADPRDVDLVFIPRQSLAALVVVLAAAVFAFPRVGLGLTFLVTLTTAGLAYEWTHFLIHTDYRPKHTPYKSVWRHHRLHHFKNEHYWFTVTTAGTADRVLGTYPDPQTVPTSPTAKNLHAHH